MPRMVRDSAACRRSRPRGVPSQWPSARASPGETVTARRRPRHERSVLWCRRDQLTPGAVPPEVVHGEVRGHPEQPRARLCRLARHGRRAEHANGRLLHELFRDLRPHHQPRHIRKQLAPMELVKRRALLASLRHAPVSPLLATADWRGGRPISPSNVAASPRQ